MSPPKAFGLYETNLATGRTRLVGTFTAFSYAQKAQGRMARVHPFSRRYSIRKEE